jgi:hypothetical protein
MSTNTRSTTPSRQCTVTDQATRRCLRGAFALGSLVVLLASGPAHAQDLAPDPIDLGTLGGAHSFAIGIKLAGNRDRTRRALARLPIDDAALGAGVWAVSASMLAAGAIRIRFRRSTKSARLCSDVGSRALTTGSRAR